MRPDGMSVEEHAHTGATYVERLPPVLLSAPPPESCTWCGAPMVVLDVMRADAVVVTCQGRRVGDAGLPVRVSWCSAPACGRVHGMGTPAPAPVLTLVRGNRGGAR